MEFRILGPLEVVDGDRSLPLGGPRQRALLACLLTRSNEVVSTDRLVDQIWGARPPKTAVNTIQYYVSQLRRSLGADRVVTRAPGYLIRVEPGELDLHRFEALIDQDSAAALREALALWRGPAFSDLAFESFAQAEAARLEELRLAALERRLDLDLEDGRDTELVGELEGLVAQHPLRERLRCQLMLALYRSGRQADALGVYRTGRRTMIEELGIVPGPTLQRLERAILRHDASLLLTQPAESETRAEEPTGSIVVASLDAAAIDVLLAVAEALARSKPPRELILVRLVHPDDLASASRALQDRSNDLVGAGIASRTAVFTAEDPGAELTRLAGEQRADLVLLDAPTDLLAAGELTGVARKPLDSAPCDVAIVVSRDQAVPRLELPVLVPFAGADHDWAAVELAAWIASASGSTLRLLGREAELGLGSRDASRLLASASLLIQRVVRVPTEPMLVKPGSKGILRAAENGGLLVFGLSDRWREEGLGETRLAIARRAACPVFVVRKGLRPGGIAPSGTLTRFTWSLAAPRS